MTVIIQTMRSHGILVGINSFLNEIVKNTQMYARKTISAYLQINVKELKYLKV